MRIPSNSSAGRTSPALRAIQSSQKNLNSILNKLSSGKISVKDNPAAVAISQQLDAQVSGLQSANRGINYAQATARVAEGALASQQEDLLRMRELAVQSANGTLSDRDRSALSEEFNQLKANLNSTANQTNFNGKNLLNGDYEASVQTGSNAGDQVDFELEGSSASDLGVSGSDISSQEGAEDALAEIDSALNRISEQRASIGAFSNRLDSASNANSIAAENLAAASSQLTDVDFAEEVGKAKLEEIKLKASIKAAELERKVNESALGLLGGRSKK